MYNPPVQLPEDEATLLRSLSSDLPRLRARVRTLRARGWTLASIGLPLRARRSTVRSWELHPAPSPPAASSHLPPPPDPPLLLAHSPHPSPHPVPSPDQQLRIQALAPLARRARAGTPPSSNLARARDELNSLVLRLYDEGVPISTLAQLAGVTYRAMSVRVRTAAQLIRPT